MRKVCGESGTGLREVTGEDDHGHPLAGYPPKVAIPAPVNRLKGVSARRYPAGRTRLRDAPRRSALCNCENPATATAAHRVPDPEGHTAT